MRGTFTPRETWNVCGVLGFGLAIAMFSTFALFDYLDWRPVFVIGAVAIVAFAIEIRLSSSEDSLQRLSCALCATAISGFMWWILIVVVLFLCKLWVLVAKAGGT